MKKKWVFGFTIASISIASLVFIILGEFNIGILLMTAIFALSNGYRSISFKEKGFVREAKWMKGMSIVFAVLFFVVLGIMFF